MKIVIPKETRQGERRVALVPESCKKLIQAGYAVSIEKGAGEAAFYPDSVYRDAGCAIEGDPKLLIGSADIILKANPPSIDSSRNEVEWMKPSAVVLASLMPLRHLDVVRALAARKITAFSTDAIPRITRAQAMDTLSSMANITGYKGAIIAATELGKYCPMFMTAAGTVFPAKVFVVGAAVAGLQAIATSRRLGANVTATDVRPEVKEQIESIGAKYVGIELKKSASIGGGYAGELSEEDKAMQRQMLAEQCAAVDVVITTALIGGVFAPKLITKEMVAKMKPGSVIVDLGADGCQSRERQWLQTALRSSRR
jgi:NAD(P) transhydrogenase subunit alpha